MRDLSSTATDRCEKQKRCQNIDIVKFGLDTLTVSPLNIDLRAHRNFAVFLHSSNKAKAKFLKVASGWFVVSG